MYFYFGQWRYEPQSGALSRPDRDERLPPRLATLFLCLIQNAGQVQEKSVLIQQVWGDRIVNDDALARAIAQLRQILGDNAAAPEYIETIPRRGYRFLSPVSTSKSDSADSEGVKKPFAAALWVLAATVCVALTLLWIYWPDNNQQPTQWQKAIAEAKRATANDALEYHPEISPSGRYLAFTERSHGVMLVRVQDANGRNLHTIAEPEAWVLSPVWSPDEQQIAVAVVKGEQCQVLVITLSSLLREMKTPCSMPNTSPFLDWSDDGEQLAFVAKDGEEDAGYHIYSLNLSSQQITQLTRSDNNTLFDTRPRFSPDGTKIGFIRGTDAVRNIYIKDIAPDAKAQAITHHKAYSQSFVWLKDSRSIIYDGNPKGDRNLWLWREGVDDNINLGARNSQNPSITTDNGQLAFQEVNYQANLLAIDPADNSSAMIVSSPKYDNHPALSPDGQQLAYNSNRFGRDEIWLYNFDTKSDQRLLSMDDEHLVSPHWTADQTRVLVSSFGEKGYFCYEYDLQLAVVTRISPPGFSITQCSYDKSGAILALTRGEQSGLLVRVLDNNAELLNEELRISRAMAFDKHSVILSLADKDGLFRYDVRDNSVADILADFPRHNSGSWTLSESHLYYINARQDNQIWRLNPETQQAEQVYESVRPAIAGNIASTYDGQKLVLSVTGNNHGNIFIAKSQKQGQ